MQQHGPQSQERPFRFALGMLPLVTAQFRAAVSLFEVPKEQFDPPAVSVDLGHLRIAEPLRIEHRCHQVPRLAAVMHLDQPQPQRRLSSLRGFVGPEIDDTVGFPSRPQLLQQAARFLPRE